MTAIFQGRGAEVPKDYVDTRPGKRSYITVKLTQDQLNEILIHVSEAVENNIYYQTTKEDKANYAWWKRLETKLLKARVS